MTTTTDNNKNEEERMRPLRTETGRTRRGQTKRRVISSTDILEEGKKVGGMGMYKRAGKGPSNLSVTSKGLSVTSMMYDVDDDGKLDEDEQAMRDMDTDNRGYLTNEKVYKFEAEVAGFPRRPFPSLSRSASNELYCSDASQRHHRLQ
jgi:hypothetical protein